MVSCEHRNAGLVLGVFCQGTFPVGAYDAFVDYRFFKSDEHSVLPQGSNMGDTPIV